LERVSFNISGPLLLKLRLFKDDRGFFFESYQATRYHNLGISPPFVQDNTSFSKRGVLRGLHYQKNFPQGKLVSVLQGRVYDVAVDIRRHSPTFGQHISVWLDDENHHQFYIPPGFAHGFFVTSDTALFHYKCTDYYHPNDEGGLCWNDPALNIDWPLDDALPILSPKDATFPLLAELAQKSALPLYESII